MKTKSKALLLTLCAVLLVVTSVFGTMAYLTDTAEVNNTFTVGNVDIDLYETDAKDATKTTTKNEYHLLPGKTYTKDPTIKVLEGSEDCYVRMLVTISFDAFPEFLMDEDMSKFFGGYEDEKWTRSDTTYDIENNSVTYIYRYNEKSTAGETYTLFETISIPEDFDNAEMDALKGMKINIIAQAIQADGSADAKTVWEKW